MELGFVESKPRDLGSDRGYRVAIWKPQLPRDCGEHLVMLPIGLVAGRLLYCWDGGSEEIISD
jgi:hypothetical protein